MCIKSGDVVYKYIELRWCRYLLYEAFFPKGKEQTNLYTAMADSKIIPLGFVACLISYCKRIERTK